MSGGGGGSGARGSVVCMRMMVDFIINVHIIHKEDMKSAKNTTQKLIG